MGERIRWPVVVRRAREIYAEYDGGVTLRQLMYRLVAEGAGFVSEFWFWLNFRAE
ncbi:hypothetical protein [Streptomyces sp. NPDC007172]|uniref:hypothetical protein n=1 Tax=Streptomyces sp. NPDC007172 TaxID=3364776 RepID=UPI003698817B